MKQIDEPRFKQEFSVSKGAFVQIDNHVFHKNSRNPQRPVNEQLMVTLKRFGCFGNGASVGMLARFFRISEGTVELYTNRCIMAILSLESQRTGPSIPNKKYNKQMSIFRVYNEHCIGLLKGRFQSLKGLRLRLQDEDDEEDAQRIIAWIRLCAVLHNLLLSEDFDWVDIDVDEDGDE
ncbi:hypothetical protein PsorP6_006589 [Peronosclerospora sorghi]|uniref:Uncharacterized protein n=1 Tax=Peronosclerospora sorghi TaxID=230839 RepID=A0ACC0W5C3_9STRA|nr:hypothetical protein PsorP6_006589 [Peronosclerospora sorghi]